MIELAIAIGGALVGALIAVGVHKKEHDMIKEELAENRKQRERLEERVDVHDVLLGKMSVSLDYLVQAVDRNYDAIEAHKNTHE